MQVDQNDIEWAAKKTRELFSWAGVGWVVALLAGIWGAVIGIGAFKVAYSSLVIATAPCALKWGHETKIHNKARRTFAFSIGLVLMVGIMVGIWFWTRARAASYADDQAKLAPLGTLPKLNKQVTELTQANIEANKKISAKQTLIEDLTNTVISQQQTIASEAHKDLKIASSAINLHIAESAEGLNAHIDQFQSVTSQAVRSGAMPDRTLSSFQKDVVRRVYEKVVCPISRDKWTADDSIWIWWDPDAEAVGYAQQFIDLFNSTACKYSDLRMPLPQPHTSRHGLFLVAADWNNPTPIAAALRDAFLKTSIPYQLASDPTAFRNNHNVYGVAIVIAAK